jgi:ribosomal protein S27AE
MARAIDADRLKQAIDHDYYEHYTKYHDSDQTALIDMVMDDIDEMPTLTPPNEPLTPYPDGDTSIIACPHCGSGEYLHNEDGNEQNYCGQCGQAIDWSRPPEVSP